MPKSSSKSKKQQQQQEVEEQPQPQQLESSTAVVKVPAAVEDGSVTIHPKQIKCLMIGVTTIVIMNLILTIVAVVLGLQIKGEVDGMQEKLEPLMELAETLDGMDLQGLTSGGGGGGGITPPGQ